MPKGKKLVGPLAEFLRERAQAAANQKDVVRDALGAFQPGPGETSRAFEARILTAYKHRREEVRRAARLDAARAAAPAASADPPIAPTVGTATELQHRLDALAAGAWGEDAANEEVPTDPGDAASATIAPTSGAATFLAGLTAPSMDSSFRDFPNESPAAGTADVLSVVDLKTAHVGDAQVVDHAPASMSAAEIIAASLPFARSDEGAWGYRARMIAALPDVYKAAVVRAHAAERLRAEAVAAKSLAEQREGEAARKVGDLRVALDLLRQQGTGQASQDVAALAKSVSELAESVRTIATMVGDEGASKDALLEVQRQYIDHLKRMAGAA